MGRPTHRHPVYERPVDEILSLGNQAAVPRIRYVMVVDSSTYQQAVHASSRRLTSARWLVPYDIGAAPPRAGLLRYRPGATGGNDRRTPGYEGL
jgi:hypothetical protein